MTLIGTYTRTIWWKKGREGKRAEHHSPCDCFLLVKKGHKFICHQQRQTVQLINQTKKTTPPKTNNSPLYCLGLGSCVFQTVHIA